MKADSFRISFSTSPNEINELGVNGWDLFEYPEVVNLYNSTYGINIQKDGVLARLQDIDEKVGKDYRVISETLDLNGVVSTIATFDAPDIASVLADIKNYEITFNYSYTSADGKLIIENHLGVSDNNELMQINLDIPAEKNVINIKGHAVGSTISITNFVITCHIRPLNIDM